MRLLISDFLRHADPNKLIFDLVVLALVSSSVSRV